MSKLHSSPDWFAWTQELMQFSGAHLHITTDEGELDLVATLQPHPVEHQLFCVRLRNRDLTFFLPAQSIPFIRKTGGARSCFLLDLKSPEDVSLAHDERSPADAPPPIMTARPVSGRR